MDEKKVDVKETPKVDKELEQTRKEAHIKNLKREISETKLQRIEVEKREALFLKKIAASKKSSDEVLKNFKILRITWAYEEKQEYLDALKEINMCIFEENSLNWENQKTQIKNNLEAIDAQLKSTTEELERVEKEMKKNE